jgi:peptide/nickel transport system substrate-binding protein
LAASAAAVVFNLGAPISTNAENLRISPQQSSSQIIDFSDNFGPFSDTFNPLDTTSGLDSMAIQNAIYEPLVQFDVLDASVTYPWLATSWHWSNGGKTLTLDLRHGVTWSDGKPFTSADVAFTFNLIKKSPALNTYGITFTSVQADGPYQVVMTFPHPEFSDFYYIGSQVMVPAHIWATVNDPTTWPDLNPVGTGPYLLKSYAPAGTTFVRNAHYWQKDEPKLYGFDYLDDESAATENIQLNVGDVAWSGATEPEIQKLFVARDPKDNHYWYPGLLPDAVVPNVTVWPLNLVQVRKAISLAINRQVVHTRGQYGLEQVVSNPTGLTPDQFPDWLAPQYKDAKLGYNVADARALLKGAGLKFNSKGLLLDQLGKPLTLTMIDPSGNINEMSSAEVIAGDLASIGITLNVVGTSSAVYSSDLASGSFDMTLDANFAPSGPSPFIFYNDILNYSLSAPVGKTAGADFGRWDNSATQRYIADYEAATTKTQEVQAITGIESILVNDVPIIPTTYQVSWGNYRTNQVVGWPTPANPYASPGAFDADWEVVLLHLTPVG